jgi:hypothetical protein
MYLGCLLELGGLGIVLGRWGGVVLVGWLGGLSFAGVLVTRVFVTFYMAVWRIHNIIQLYGCISFHI